MITVLPRSSLVCGLVVLLAAVSPGARAAPLFEDDAALQVTLKGPLTRVYAPRPDQEPREYTARWSYEEPDGRRMRLSVGVQQRGNVRRNCAMPPLKLDFESEKLTGTIMDGQNKLKLVGVCDEGRAYRDYLTLEYLIYRAYALLTPASFGTRLLELRYIDTRGTRSLRRQAFLIEDVDDVAARLGMEELEVPAVSPGELDGDAAALVELFSLMIGNTDFSTIRSPEGKDCCHNVKLLTGGDAGIVPVPYDFDSAGLVDASYALPSELLPIDDVRERYFNGLCKPAAHFEAARARLLEREAAILEVFAGADSLVDAVHDKTMTYLQDFFTMLKDDARFRSEVVEACVTPGKRG